MQQTDREGGWLDLWPIVPVGILEEYKWEVLFSFCLLVAQAILFIVVSILRPISPPKRIFGVTI
ncbi:hypothetical protein E2C01_006681 [Portunus trituberculatus]|uniref:Uncharacterized protein n=1 Tax=Portunus trituberculatus TaxID=210409 RepID=A0A5B7CW12_PORTR|nr:hypothetical protein [Portunus trituberculatus]